MKTKTYRIADANEAVASVAYRLSELVAIYPITPSSPMAELCDEWSGMGHKNVWKTVPRVNQMQSEAGVAGALHGMLQSGVLATTFTASQGLLLMLPNMYKIAGQFFPFCMHVTARSLATHALSIFGDHSDVMACRQTGFALLASNSVQEAQDMAAIAHAATLKSRIPFLHFFDGFRTSHEINTFEELSDELLQEWLDITALNEYRNRALNPDQPILRGTAQNPDVFFQAREAGNSFYDALPAILEDYLNRFAQLTGRQYQLYEYQGAPDAEDVIVTMGSSAETADLASDHLRAQGRKTGVLRVRLYRPFDLPRFLQALPPTVRRIAVLDRTKEPGSLGEPLYLDVCCALAEGKQRGIWKGETETLIIGGRYGLGSKEFTPAMARAVFDELQKDDPKNRFTVGITDDVTHTSLPVVEEPDDEPDDTFQAIFYGLGSDGTVGANKNTIKIIGKETGQHAQAYFVYDSKKSGAMTVSHLRFGPNPIRAPYLISKANFIACHQFSFIDRQDLLANAAEGSVLLLNCPYTADQIWDRLPFEMQSTLIEKKMKMYCIDAYKIAREASMGNRINTIMQVCFFAISEILPVDVALQKIKESIEKSYGKKGQTILDRNYKAVDLTLEHLQAVTIPADAGSTRYLLPPVPAEAPDFVQKVTGVILAGKGDRLPVSAFPVDGTWPTATSQWEKRSIAQAIPLWEPDLCIQCGKCSLVCPHAAIRGKAYPEALGENAPESFRSKKYRSRDLEDFLFTIQTAPDDCTGCQLCVAVCPAKDRKNPSRKAINMHLLEPVLDEERVNYDHFLQLPETDTSAMRQDIKAVQLKRPLFEYSGACAGCGETPYIKLLTQICGDRLLVANATGCSSIYGGNLPTTPYTVDAHGRGPAWANSLFEDNAEFGYGIRLAVDKKTEMARETLESLAADLGDNLASELLRNPQSNDEEIEKQRLLVTGLREKLAGREEGAFVRMRSLLDFLVRKSVWCIGGDGWAYDIGFGGLDHVLASGRNVNILVLDTEVYSNTGGQASKSTPTGAVAKFASTGKEQIKKDLGRFAMGYENVYVASIAMGARDTQTLQALQEAESFDGPSLVIAYSHCVAHGYNMNMGMDQQKLAVQTGYWPMYRYDPRRRAEDKPALQIDSAAPKTPLKEYMQNEVRFRMLFQMNRDHAEVLLEKAQNQVNRRYDSYQYLAGEGKDNNHEH